MFHRSRRLQERKTTKIAITGMSEGSGTTHLAVAISNYYASRERLDVLFVECELSKGIIGLRTSDTWMAKGISGFERAGVAYMPECPGEQAVELMAEPYDVIIFETKGWPASMRGIFCACDRVIITVSARPWHYPAMQENLKHMIQLEHEIVQGDYCSFGLTEGGRKKLNQELHLQCTGIPMIADPLRLTNTDIRFLKQFLGN